MLRNGFYNVASVAIRTILSLVSIPILIRLIGLEQYGLWVLVTAVIGLISLAEVGLSIVAAVFTSRDLASQDDFSLSATISSIVSITVLLTGLIVLVLWVSTDSLLGFFPDLLVDERIIAAQALQISAIVVAMRLFQHIMVGFVQAFEQYPLISALTAVQAVFTNGGLIVVAWLGGGVVELMEWQALTSILIVGIYCAFAWRLLHNHRVQVCWSWSRFREISRYSATTWTATLGGALFTQGDRLLVGSILGTELLGIYGAITSIASQINVLSAWLVQPLLPSLSAGVARLGRFDDSSIQQQTRRALQMCTAFALAMGMAILCLAPELLSFIADRPVTSVEILALELACAIYALYSINAVGYYILLGIDKTFTSMIVQIASGGLSLSLIVIGVQWTGLLGAIVGNAGYLGVFCLTFIGMRFLGLKVADWAGWIAAPVLWFVGCALGIILIPSDLLIRSSLLLVSFVGIGLWFVMHNQTEIKSVLRRVS